MLRKKSSHCNLPPPPAKILIWANCDQLIQAFDNLLVNAIKYTEKGGITATLVDEEDAVRICVSDTGSGISEESLRHLFESFEHTEDGHKNGGAGLGLYVARSLVQLHGGSLTVTTTVGTGSTFTILLPKKPKA